MGFRGGLGLRIQDLGLRVLGFRVQGLRLLGFRVCSLGSRGLGFQVEGLGLRGLGVPIITIIVYWGYTGAALVRGGFRV